MTYSLRDWSFTRTPDGGVTVICESHSRVLHMDEGELFELLATMDFAAEPEDTSEIAEELKIDVGEDEE